MIYEYRYLKDIYEKKGGILTCKIHYIHIRNKQVIFICNQKKGIQPCLPTLMRLIIIHVMPYPLL